MTVNPVLLEVFKNRFASIAEEMGVTLMRTACSPNIKERRDFSCAVFDAGGDMVAQAAHIPVHLGSMPLSVKAAIAALDLEPGDMAVLNDPFSGGTHLPDITLVAPVHIEDRTAFHVASRAHHADVGGITPGSMPLSTSIFQEGLVIPAVKIVTGGQINRGLLRLILANVRTPDEREGDFAAQIMANLTGVRRLGELARCSGLETLQHYARSLNDYAEKITRAAISALPDGTCRHTDVMDDDGWDGRDIPITVRITIAGSEATVDFTGSAPQVPGSINAVRAITVSAVLYVFRCLTQQSIPAGAGCLRPLRIITEPGTIVDARAPSAVAGGNVETAQRIVDVVLGALAPALPGRIPAASQGTMNNLTVGGLDPRTGRAFTYYETLGGGTGALDGCAGERAIHSHMTNTMNTPIEALEYACPLRVRHYGIRRGSGGRGRFPGGDGLVRELEFLSRAEVTVLSERRRHGPPGRDGGEPGAPGRNRLSSQGQIRDLPGKFTCTVAAGDVLRLETPGGGGYGTPDGG